MQYATRLRSTRYDSSQDQIRIMSLIRSLSGEPYHVDYVEVANKLITEGGETVHAKIKVWCTPSAAVCK
jgi:hypothetical protein